MPVTVRIPTALRMYTGQNARIDVQAETTGQAIEALAKAHPDLTKHLYEDTGSLRSFVNVFVGDQDVRQLQGMETPVKDGDTILIVPSVAGGEL